VNRYIVTSFTSKTESRFTNLDSRKPDLRTHACARCSIKGFAAQEHTVSGYGPPDLLFRSKHRQSLVRPCRRAIGSDQTQTQADAKSIGCLRCHQGVEPMHKAEHVVLGCTDCHGGNAARGLTKEQAHICQRTRSFGKHPPTRRTQMRGSITNRPNSSVS